MNLYKYDKVKDCIVVVDAETHRAKGYINVSPFTDLLKQLSNEDLGKIRNIEIQDPYIIIYSYGSIDLQSILEDLRFKLDEIYAKAPYIIYKVRRLRKPGRKPGSQQTETAQPIEETPTPEPVQEEKQQETSDPKVIKRKRKKKKRK